MNEPEDQQQTPKKEFGDTIHVRAPMGLKGKVVRASRRRNIKLTAWMIEAMEEKLAREDAERGEN